MPSLMRQINVISRCGGQYRTARLEETGLAGYQGNYLLCVCKNPGISQDQVARRIYVNKSNAARALSALEALGYVERRQSETDRRVTLVYPTEKALEIVPLINRVNCEWTEYITEGFTSDELDQFLQMMERVFERAKDYVDGKAEEPR